MDNNDIDNAPVMAVALKLPMFWTSQPEVWFAQAEAQFAIKKITTDATRYYYVVAALDQDTAGRLLDTLRNPPANDKYVSIKQQLLRTYGLTRRERAARLLDMPGLGDRKPSALLSEMRSLSGGHTDCMLFEEVFLRQMPTDIRLQLAQQDFTDLNAVGERADALWLAKKQNINAGDINKVVRVARPAKQPQVSSPTTDNSELCFYHAKFGDKAQKCRSPCKFAGNALAGRQ
jgi:hypothetical protein